MDVPKYVLFLQYLIFIVKRQIFKIRKDWYTAFTVLIFIGILFIAFHTFLFYKTVFYFIFNYTKNFLFDF